jgi:hypothetical protein
VLLGRHKWEEMKLYSYSGRIDRLKTPVPYCGFRASGAIVFVAREKVENHDGRVGPQSRALPDHGRP